MTKSSPTTRHNARRLALQAIYQWQVAQTPMSDIEHQFIQENRLDKVDVDYFLQLLREIPACVQQLDELMLPVLDRPLADLNPVELAVLRLALFELTHRIDIPYRVVIAEALRLTKTFGAIEGFKYVNAILDRIAHQVRTVETAKKISKSSGTSRRFRSG